jgi:signal transduction histidine kinase
VFPSALSDRGIAAALEADITRSRSATRFDHDRASDTVRYSPEIEAAVYFCCVEALQNAAKHAPHAAAGVRLTHDRDWLVFEVTDAGPGFNMRDVRGGTGLQGMADRLAAVGGTLTVRSTPGHGTTVTGRLEARSGHAL